MPAHHVVNENLELIIRGELLAMQIIVGAIASKALTLPEIRQMHADFTASSSVRCHDFCEGVTEHQKLLIEKHIVGTFDTIFSLATALSMKDNG